MAWNPLPMQAADAKAFETLNGNSLLSSGSFYVQYGAATALSNTTGEVSLLAGSPTVWTGAVSGSYQGPASTLYLPPGSLAAGTTIEGFFEGIIQTTGTPGLRMRLGIVGPDTATTFTALSDNASLALTAAAAGSYFRVYFEMVVLVGGSSGSFRSTIGYAQGTTAAGSALRFVQPAPQDVTTLDLTKQYSIDIRATFDSASASNTITLQSGRLFLVG